MSGGCVDKSTARTRTLHTYSISISSGRNIRIEFANVFALQLTSIHVAKAMFLNLIQSVYQELLNIEIVPITGIVLLVDRLDFGKTFATQLGIGRFYSFLGCRCFGFSFYSVKVYSLNCRVSKKFSIYIIKSAGTWLCNLLIYASIGV